MKIQRGSQTLYTKFFDMCEPMEPFLKVFYGLVGFPYWEKCSSKGGKFCFDNKSMGKAPVFMTKVLENSQYDGNLKTIFDAKFDGNRTSCVMAELSINRADP